MVSGTFPLSTNQVSGMILSPSAICGLVDNGASPDVDPISCGFSASNIVYVANPFLAHP